MKPENKGKQQNSTVDKEEKNKVTAQYSCGQSCRICPFPGLKCRTDAHMIAPIK